MPYDLTGIVIPKVRASLESYTERQVARYMKQVELHLAQREASAGHAQLLLERVRETIAEIEKRVVELERIDYRGPK